MANYARLIELLESSEEPDRGIDGELAKLVGWQKTVVSLDAARAGQPGRKSHWRTPHGDDAIYPPAYTADFDRAFDFANQILPNHIAAVTWKIGESSRAQLEGATVSIAPNAQRALCAAVLRALD